MFEVHRVEPSPGKFALFRLVLFLRGDIIQRIEPHIVVNANLEPLIVECTCPEGGETVWCTNDEVWLDNNVLKNNGCNDSNRPNCIKGTCGKHDIRSIIQNSFSY